jgi:D-cysteine desulfhydrase
MNLTRFPRRRYTQGQTPIEKLSRLSTMLGGPTLYMKRDDLLGLAAAVREGMKCRLVLEERIA